MIVCITAVIISMKLFFWFSVSQNKVLETQLQNIWSVYDEKVTYTR